MGNEMPHKRDSLLFAAGLLCVLALLFGLGTVAFFYDPVRISRLFWFGPFATFASFLFVVMSRKALALSTSLAAAMNFIGSISAMSLECSTGGCVALGGPIAIKIQIILLAMFTPQTILAISVLVLVLVSNRRLAKQQRV